MVKQSEQVITKETLDQSKCHPELVEEYSSLYQEVTLRQTQCDNKILKKMNVIYNEETNLSFLLVQDFSAKASFEMTELKILKVQS